MIQTIVKLEAEHSTYNMADAASNSMTVGELINYLQCYDSDCPIILSHDGGYTFGSIHTYDIETAEIEED